MKIGNEDLPSYMSFAFTFTGMRLQGSTFCPVNWDVEIELIGDNENFTREEHSSAFQRMHYWVELALADVVILGVENYDSNLARECENLTMWLPENATDDLLSQALHSKLQTVAGPAVILGEIQLNPSDAPTRYFFSPVKKGQYNISKENKTLTDVKVYHTVPWYCRRDSLTYELIVDDQQTRADYDDMLKDYQDPLDILDAQLAEQLNTSPDHGKEAEIYQVGGTQNSDNNK
jgi:hypothetical protein